MASDFLKDMFREKEADKRSPEAVSFSDFLARAAKRSPSISAERVDEIMGEARNDARMQFASQIS
ncbi:MAG: hypothetical protein Greene041662_262 [Candidatus Peregrinibacteria bacterium Greene0416_62]|nr:MAG: hypothetical protein Greene041662_262 [Candidatus Peregrinibacteria bacterium Greene0416_62]TSC99816.1 MAG: hypothetical protein Greene101449_507 [Candidatus Peregrinibacteria bacterium Greene1014_49]